MVLVPRNRIAKIWFKHDCKEKKSYQKPNTYIHIYLHRLMLCLTAVVSLPSFQFEDFLYCYHL